MVTVKEDEEKMVIKIDKNTTFYKIKDLCCNFWDISNSHEFVITDENEGIIFDEGTVVNNFIRDYYHSGYFRIVSLVSLKTRTDLLQNQKQKVKNFNKVINKDVKYY